ncbi:MULTISPECIES: hypothetical protein [Novosphingobium]|uniref:Uncharacterized protein n=1 Tax=Novosphingobium nitrogenifigens DSM 19370 TaxID=983920 RepID=F1Z4M9_9SPHN|nr:MULTISPECIES: hypothetical protein [Novosphingobium]EGD60440.1 hypothetical protein Y88_2917 [Novosphingobium nitrogenifigens DSM 19370]MBF5091031.1 hypothetical protein [Novosphingobium sp. NBM11]
MFYTSAFDEFACVPCGITVTNPAMVARIRAQSAHLTDYDIAAHLGNAIASSTDAAHGLAWEQSQFGEARAETLVDAEYFDDLVAAWSLVASERGIDSLDGLLIDVVVH